MLYSKFFFFFNYFNWRIITLQYCGGFCRTPAWIMEKAMAPHSSTPAWKIPWMGKPGRLQSMRSLRVGHDWATSLSLFTFMPWRRKWQPTPVFLPRESQGRGSLVGCRLWGRAESDTTEATWQQQQHESAISIHESPPSWTPFPQQVLIIYLLYT